MIARLSRYYILRPTMPTAAQAIKEGKTPIIINRMMVKYLKMVEQVYNKILDRLFLELKEEMLSSFEIKE